MCKDKNWMDKVRKRAQGYRKKNPYRFWAHSTRKNHMIRGVTVNLSVNQIEDIGRKSEYCSLCGEKLDWTPGKGRMRPNSPTLDRVNNEPFMDLNNIMVVCWRCNTMKRDIPLSLFIEICKRIGDYNE
jgi:hypothetical protein